MKTSNLTALLATAAVLACGSDNGTAPHRAPEVRFILGDTVTDTVGAALPTPLVVEVHDSTGASIPAGTLVRFAAVQVPTDTFPSVWVQDPGSSKYQTVVAEVADKNGRVAVYTKLGLREGTSRVIVSVPTYGIIDTAHFTVKPGNAAAVIIVSHDTTLTVGGTYTVTGGVVDVYGNLRPDSVVWSVSGSGITRDSTGLVRTSAVGAYTISVHSLALKLQATIHLSIVPAGQLAAVQSGLRLVTFDLAGRKIDTLDSSVSNGGIGIHPAWIPGTEKIIFTLYDGNLQQLYTVDTTGSLRKFFATNPLAITHQAQPTPSADGSWIYFVAFDTGCTDYCLHRMRANGSSVEQLGRYAGTWTLQPAPSPDGSKVAFVNPTLGTLIRVLDVATHTLSSWSVQGSSPVWSRDGNSIAYVNPTDNQIHLISPNGTGGRTLTHDPIGFNSGNPVTWSPDSQWIVASQSSMLVLVNAQTGTTIPLTYSVGMSFPSWK